MANSIIQSSLLSLDTLTQIHDAAIAIVHTEWNEHIVGAQIEGAQRIFEAQQVKNIKYYTVPGAFEMPFACQALIHSKICPDAIICFGAVIQGGTPHFDYVCKAVVEGITQLNASSKIPIIFGVLTLNNEAQAWERLGGAHGHKGEEAAIAALKMIQLNRTIKAAN